MILTYRSDTKIFYNFSYFSLDNADDIDIDDIDNKCEMAPVIYCFCSNCSCPAMALVTLMQSYDKQNELSFHKVGRPVRVIDRKSSNSDISSNIEALVILVLLVCILLGKVFLR